MVWTCPACTLENSDGARVCDACGKTRPSAVEQPAVTLPPPPPQRLSTKAGSPSRGFGSCDRWYTQKLAARFGNTPAPGAYNV